MFRNSIHYHTVYRDHVRDYGADLSLTTTLDTMAATAKRQFDFDGDGKTGVSVFRDDNRYLNRSTSDTPVPDAYVR